MTPEQEDQFAKFGCACRCLLALAAANRNPQTKEEFIDAFSKEYPFWERLEQCGITDTGMVLDIARKLNLANTFQIFINKNKVREQIKNKQVRFILLFTEKESPDGGPLSDFFHCSLVSLTPLEDGHFHRAQVNNQLQISLPERLSDTDIENRSGYFFLLS